MTPTYTEVLIPYPTDRISKLPGVAQFRQPTREEWESEPAAGTVLENVEVRKVGRVWEARWGEFCEQKRSMIDAARQVGARVAKHFQPLAPSASRHRVWDLGRLRDSHRRVEDTRNLSVYTPPTR